MEPRIQYVTAPDGVNLAFCTEGQGPPIVYMPTFGSLGHILVEGVAPGFRRQLDYLTARMTVVRYDHRGQGLSDRDPADGSLEAHVGDLLTILNRLSLDRAVLHARLYSVPVGITFAHRYPERVSHLVLSMTGARLADLIDNSPRLRAMRSLIDQDWELYTEVVARVVYGWPDHEVASRLAAQVRASTTPAAALRALDIQRTWDATPLLPGIRTPSLVVHFPNSPLYGDGRWSREMAAGIPGAQFLVLDSYENAAIAAYEFISGEEPTPDPGAAPLPEGTAIILFADIVDSTALTEQLGDAAFRARATRLDAAMRSGIRECGGTPIDGKVLGDGVMAVFSSARQAVDAAFRCRAAADGTGLALHLGIHAGDVTREGDNVYGGAVNIASRVCSLSAPDEILVSATVRDLARTSAGVSFEDRGEHALKGIADPMHVYAVRPQ